MTFPKKPTTPEAKEAQAIALENKDIERDEKVLAEEARLAVKKADIPEDETGFRRKLSKDARAQVTARAKTLVEEELMKQERDRFMQEEIKRLRAEAGVAAPSSLGGTLDELVELTLNLGYEGQAFIQLNQPHGICYHHGVTYKVPRHIANTLNEIAFAGFRLRKHTRGESFFRERDHGTVLSGISGQSSVPRNQIN